ncbi:uncharacterized protein LOC128718798 [Anopheles marshallii]|uniref:uncharacterized protein LOC128718798 n=1 Tax=Anopheles marshallii TaxID=1521116 RepID=UPI00237B081E|nr:uncharacterized protein LOC128718798 [Anopheles marshallii]
MGSFGLLCKLMSYLLICVALITLIVDIPKNCAENSSYSISVRKYVCIDAPYKETILQSCKSIPKRNAPTMVYVSLDVPKLYDKVVLKVIMFYKFSTYQPFLISIEGNACEYVLHPPQFGVEKHVYNVIEETLPELLTPCPAGNHTYNITWYFNKRHALKNVPAGEYKLRFKLLSHPGNTLFGMDVYISVRNTGIISSFMTQ